MQFQITKIEFDFDDDSAIEVCFDDFLTDEYKQEIYDEILGSFWEADDEDDLIEEITCATGWCIKSIDYRHILTDYRINS